MEQDEVMQTTGGADETVRSYISPIGYSNSSECGYCRGRSAVSKKRYSYYAVTNDLSPSFYQSLVDRCWRRSGTLLYRPNQRSACCPHYTLRLDSNEFRPSKDQRQAINRFNNYVVGEPYTKEAARLHPRSREESKRRDAVFDLVERVHEAERERVASPPEPAHNFTVALEPDNFTEEKYFLFENYQRLVHKEPPSKISRSGFRRFLCDSPIRRTTDAGPDGTQRKLGSFHQCYRLDGKLVAIGVLDLLPHCVSAVYFLYHESIHKYNPGKLGAMREIALAIEGGYRWWYSGYYIHTCPKMQYKNDYAPQYILDPGTLTWHPLTKGDMAIFDDKGYARFPRVTAPNGGSKPDNPEGDDQDHNSDDKEAGESQGDDSDGKSADENDSDDDDGQREFLLQSNMPGILSLDEVAALDLDDIAVVTDGHSEMFSTSDLVVWRTQTIAQYPSLKARVAELVAAVGPDLLDELCLDFRTRRQSF
ncbi:hypothetical protein RB599_004084 [Gaeumannomyces hyphopodioides]